MPEIGTSGSMSGDGKRSDAEMAQAPRPSSTTGRFRAGYGSGSSGGIGVKLPEKVCATLRLVGKKIGGRPSRLVQADRYAGAVW